jgi:putative phosphoesterase
MLTIIGDTHGTDSHRLTGETLDAVREADHVLHTGDFTTEAVYEAIAAEAGADTIAGSAPLTAVQGNNETPALRERLPQKTTVDAEGIRFALAHGHRHDETSLGLFARETEADVVVVGHSHRPSIDERPYGLLVNPGSYADPRRYRPAHATVRAGTVELRTPDGAVLAEHTV